MNRHRFLSLIAVAAIATTLSTSAWAQRPCISTANQCPNASVTTSKIQIGGAGSLSSNGASLSNPARLDDGTIAEADLEFSFDRTTGRLTVVAKNVTTTTATLSGFGFNTTADVTNVTLVSETGSLNWEVAYDRDRTDSVVDSHPSLNGLKLDGFGRFNVYIANKGIATGQAGGNPNEILAGQQVTYVLQISGNISSITACSFTSVGSYIPPGDKIVTAVGRFQRGVNGGSGFVGPCTGGDLLVDLASFRVEDLDPVTLAWDTASEIDNAGFAILREDVRSRQTVRLNSNLIPSTGSEVSGGAYTFQDPTAVNGRRYRYSVEDWDTRGVNTIHKAESAVPNPKNSPVRLVAPVYEAEASGALRFRWESDARLRAVIEVSADGRFEDAETMRLRVGARPSREVTFVEMAQILKLAQTENGVYWRVTGKDSKGVTKTSETFFLRVD